MATLDSKKIKSDKEKRFIAICLTTVCELLAAPYLAFIVHQYFNIIMHLGERSVMAISYSYFSSLKMLFTNFGVQLWFVLIEIAYVLYIIWILANPKARITNVREIAVTDKITIPISVGNGQHGAARFATDKEMEAMFSTFSFTGTETVQGNGGLVVEMTKSGNTEKIKFVKKNLHSLIIGATGAGKTRRILLPTVWLQLISGYSIVISDVKGEIYYFTNEFARKMKYKVIGIDLRNPRKSAHYNFLQPVLNALKNGDKAKAIDSTWDIVSVLVGEQKGEPLWYNGETATIAAAILALCMEADEQYRNLTNVYYFLAYMCAPHPETGKTPLGLYLKTLDDGHPAKTVFAMAEVAADRTKSSFYTSAMGTLRLFTNPNVAEMTSKSDFDLEDIGKEKTIVYLMIPDEKKTLYPLASIFINQMYIAQVELANRNGLRLPVPTDYDLDEVGNMPVIPVLGNLTSAGRSRGVRANLVIQDYQQLQTKYKDDFETIKTCCQVKVYLKSDNPKTLEEISKGLGKYTVEVTSASTSASTAQKGNDVNISNSSNMTGRELLTPNELSLIGQPYALCMITGEHPSVTQLPDLAAYQINQIWGLGNEEHNRKVMEEQEQMREERESVDTIPLWGIWKKYKDMLEEDAAERLSFLN